MEKMQRRLDEMPYAMRIVRSTVEYVLAASKTGGKRPLPPLARIGMSETEAHAKGLGGRVAKLPMTAVLRTRTTSESDGFMKALVDADDRGASQAHRRGRGHWGIVGTASDIVDQMEERFKGRAADGFNVLPATLPGGLDDFISLLVPELQRRGLFRTEYEAVTLRDHLGLLRPVSPWRK